MEHFDSSWEREYLKGNALNKYPFDFVVSLTLNLFGKIKNKSQIKVLDIGCGVGNNSMFFAKEGFDVLGIDGSETAIEVARKRFADENLNGKFQHMFFKDIEYIEEKFDLILDRESIYTLEIEDIVNVFSSISKKLTKDGFFISFFYNQEHPDKKYLLETNNNVTFYNPINGAFGNSSRVTLFNLDIMNKCFNQANLEIIKLYNHTIIPLIGGDKYDNGIAEYIIVAKSILKK